MSNSVDQIFAKKKELERLIQRLEAKLSKSKNEYGQILTAISVMQKYGVSPSTQEPQEYTPETVADMVIQILEENPSGMKAVDILSAIQSRWKPDLMRTSLSPPLSRLKEKEVLELNGEIWRLRAKSKEPDAETSDSFAETNENDVSDLLA